MSNTLPAQPNAGGFSPIDFGFNPSSDNLDLTNNTSSVDQHSWPKPYPLYASQYPSTPTPMPAFTAPQGHYPVPVHLQPAYLNRVALGPAGCRETEAASREILSLPMFPELTDEQVGRVCAALRALAE